MWAVGENRVTAMKFKITGFYSSGVRLLHTFFCSDGAQGILKFFQGRLFNSRGASPGQISILKIIILLMIFLSFFGILCCFIE